MARLADAFEHRLGRITAVSGRGAFPLRLQYAASYIAPRLALIGDAADTVHPLAGQGVNLGLLDAAALAEVVLDAAAAGADIGARGVLRRYERWRRGDNLQMMLAMGTASSACSAPPRRCCARRAMPASISPMRRHRSSIRSSAAPWACAATCRDWRASRTSKYVCIYFNPSPVHIDYHIESGAIRWDREAICPWFI